VKNRLRTTLATAAVFAAIAGPVLATPAFAAEPAGPAWIRAAHLVPELGRMDIDVAPFSGGTPGMATTVVQGAGYADVTGYEQFPAGYYSVAVRPAGSPAGTTPVVSGTVQADAGGAYTLAALGSGDDATVVPLVDDLTPPPAGQARIRVLSAASSAPAVDVTAVDGPSVTRDAAFGTATGYTDVPAGTWTLNASAAGGSGPSGSAAVTVAAGSVYTLAVTDAASGGGLTVAPLTDAAGMAAVPVGGAATGAGGTAPSDAPRAGTGAGIGVLVLAGVLGSVAVVRRRTRGAEV
jgi:hypothetical protein